MLSKISIALTEVRKGWRGSQCCRVETLLLLMLVSALFIASVGFFFGKTCSSIPMFFGFALALTGALFASWRHTLLFILAVALILLATMFTFSYTGTDAMNYHYPMQRLLIDGWNPVFQSSIERFSALPATGRFSLYHTLFLPKVSAYCGALVACATGLFAGDAFLGYSLILALWCVAFRFAHSEWGCTTFASICFTATVTLCSKITSFLAGQVDYTAYAGFMIALLAFLSWRKTQLLGDLCLAALGMLFAMLAKSTGLICGVLAIGIGFIWTGRSLHYRYAVLLLLLFTVIIGTSPLLTAWIQYGSPFYPSLTFDPTISPVDITSDFIGNSDGESMGYVARIIYAWFSKPLAIKGCALLSGNPNFAPEFYVAGGVGGFGTFFHLMMWGSCAALALSRKNGVFWLCLFLFVTANLAPLKYIGYSRYFPQIWAIPFLALFNLLYAPMPWLTKVANAVKLPALVACSVFITPFFIRTLAYQGMQFRLEWERQHRFTQLIAESPVRQSTQTMRYVFRKRAESAGIQFVDDAALPTLPYNAKFGIPLEDIAITKQFTVVDTLPGLLRFPWREAFTHIPHPIWQQPHNAGTSNR